MRSQLAQGAQRALGPPLLKKAEQGIQDNDTGNHRRVHAMTDREGQHRRADQQVDQRVVHLPRQQAPRADAVLGFQRIRPRFLKAFLCLRFVEAPRT